MSEPGLSTVANTAVAATAVTTTATTGPMPTTEADLVPTTTITTPTAQDLTTEAASTTTAPSAAPRPDNLFVPKPKRLACMICRRRKLKCDGVKPSCSTCARLGHTCAYDEVRRKSGPKRGYVKALEERLKQVETLLKTQEPPAVAAATRESPSVPRNVPEPVSTAQKSTATPPSAFRPNSAFVSSENDSDWRFKHSSPHASSATRQQTPRAQSQPGSTPDDTGRSAYNHTIPPPMAENHRQDLVDLGLEEPLPFQDAIDELHKIFFEKVHASVPMIHRHRYLAAMTLPPAQQPPVALRYSIWTLASCVSEKYYATKDIFYQRARKYVELDYLKGFGEHIISIAYAQAHVLIASYEFKMMHFPRAWMSTGSAVRLCQMIGLNRLDSSGLDVKQCLPPPRDWTEHEERRRTFWLAFCEDRYASIGTGWPMTIDERDISTNLPSSEEAFDMSKPEQTGTLKDALTPAGASKLSAFASVVLSSAMFGRNLIHLHRPDPEDRDHDLNGEFWKRHHQLDGIILNTLMSLPANLKLPEGLMMPNVVFVHMSMHTSTICLHQAAIFKADSYHLPANVSMESKIRCITAANEITYIMRMVAHLDLSSMNSFVAFCLYVAARVFVQYLKSQPEDTQVADSLRFLLGSMTALTRLNPLTESFLVQLDVDLDTLMARNPRLHNAFPRASELPTSHPVSALAGGTYSKMPISAQLRPGFETHGSENRFMHPLDDNSVNSQTSAANKLSPPPDSTSTRHTHPPTSNSMLASQWLKVSGQSNANIPMAPTMTTSPHSGTSVIGSVGGGDSSAEPIDVAMSNHGTPSASNRPTPNSICSDQHQSDQHKQHSLHASRSIPSQSTPLNNPATSGSGHTSFNTTSVSQDHSVPPNGSSYTSGGNLFGMSPSVAHGCFNAETTNDPNFVNSWPEVGQAQSMTPMAEGVLRTFMNLVPMDAMDMSTWDQHIQ
ncbi:hypothetical protein Cpir12675_000248 [Ceratocystis pirilliformis]|uniref:Zn(2)-C6 fungal-type domain-containing protein n=1 Tax=Ceratocystis pirilliformis TaxID=259994 RepID=A0ABR3ZNU8_9PEZI